MAKKQMLFKTKGMNQDLSVSAFNPEFAFENMNLRLSTNEGNTQMSWVNEKGTTKMSLKKEVVGVFEDVTIEGIPIGTAVIDHKIVLFTTTNTDPSSSSRDYIYLLSYLDKGAAEMLCEVLYDSENGNLNFCVTNPLETLVSYEADDIKKVYWVDGRNQPRVINIANDIEDIKNGPNFQFDFIVELQLKENVKVQKLLGANGTFASGVIQYAFTYYNKHGQESNIFYTTPLYYISPKERGAAPDEKVSNAFKITCENIDNHFDFLRIYSIQRTSINGTPICRRVQDIDLATIKNATPSDIVECNGFPVFWEDEFHRNTVNHSGTLLNTEIGGITSDWYFYNKSDYPNLSIVVSSKEEYSWGSSSTDDSAICVTQSAISGKRYLVEVYSTNTPNLNTEPMSGSLKVNSVSFTDTGTSGNTVDPSELLYKGGERIIASTLEQKDGTLFLGNITIARELINEELKVTIREGIALEDDTRTIYPTSISTDNYIYGSQLTAFDEDGNSIPCAGFKKGDYYRFGIQVQDSAGRWSEPIHLGIDKQITNRCSFFTEDNITFDYNQIVLPTVKGTLPESISSRLQSLGYVKVRPVVVFPELKDRNILCQGIVCPTMFTNSRNKERQSSYFFRTKYPTGVGYESNPYFYYPFGTLPSANYPDNNYGVIPGGFQSAGEDNTIPYTNREVRAASGSTVTTVGWNPMGVIKSVEIEGNYENDNKFKSDKYICSFHSPDVEFNTAYANLQFVNTLIKQVGQSAINRTFGDIEIQTETPTISNLGSGFVHKDCLGDNMHGIVSGAYYDDTAVEDDGNNGFKVHPRMKSSCKWIVYPWQSTGSLNNDINRPSDKGSATAKLKKKVISNLRISDNTTWSNGTARDFEADPQLFSSDEVSIVKIKDVIYKGNIDTSIVPDHPEGKYFVYDDEDVIVSDPEMSIKPIMFNSAAATTAFNCENVWKTFSKSDENNKDEGLYSYRPTGSNNYTPTIWNWRDKDPGETYLETVLKKDPIRMKYKSTPHVVIHVKRNVNYPIQWDNYSLPVMEITRQINPDEIFGGKTIDAYRENKWIPCGEPVRLDNLTPIEEEIQGETVTNNYVVFEYSYGDTYYQRWDCLKTYAFTKEDINQVIEIGSFMLEGHVNIDGRYDRNRGQSNNLNMSPQNFNLMNPVYSQQDNFFTYRIMDSDVSNRLNYPNQVTWSKTKESGAEIDLWTNMTLASILELDGDKGKITKIARLNDQLLAFQDRGISQILYNERVQITTEQGVPIELQNSSKVQGKSYISNTIGCSNKWSLITTPMGIYFMDSNDKSIYLLGGQLENISLLHGFNAWCKKNIPSPDIKWHPNYSITEQELTTEYGFDNFVAHYDKLNQDVLFSNNSIALAYSEKFNAFSSFYSYGKTAFFCNLDDTGIWINSNYDTVNNVEENITTVWKHQAGNYCKFFDSNMPYWMTLIGNPEPTQDKIFTNLEFRACVEGDGEMETTEVEDPETHETVTVETGKFIPMLPFKSLEVWDEYQHGFTELKNLTGHSAMMHPNDGYHALKRKFRIWRCDVPRNNCLLDADRPTPDTLEYSKDLDLGISRHIRKITDRMRNPWLYLKLKYPAEESGDIQHKTEVHDMALIYYT